VSEPEVAEETGATKKKKAEKQKRVPFPERTPRVGELAPDFELASLGGGSVKLSELTPRGPTVLTFGSYS
jgi:hypothetical protein